MKLILPDFLADFLGFSENGKHFPFRFLLSLLKYLTKFGNWLDHPLLGVKMGEDCLPKKVLPKTSHDNLYGFDVNDNAWQKNELKD